MPERDDAMMLERACEVLRSNHHNGQDDWRVMGDDSVGSHLYSPSLVGTLTEFEAVAIASAYAVPAAPPQGAAEGDAGLAEAADCIRKAIEGRADDAPMEINAFLGPRQSAVYPRVASLRALLAAARRPPCPSKAWALGFAHGLRDGCPGPERFWEHGDDFAAGFDAARWVKDELPAADARPHVGEATRYVMARVRLALDDAGDDCNYLEIHDERRTIACKPVKAKRAILALRECGMEVPR